MTTNLRRFAAAASLTLVLGSTSAIAAPSRDSGGAPERNAVVRVVQKLMQKFFGAKTTADIVPPIPAPNPNP